MKPIPLLAEEGWRDSLIEVGAPGAKREPDRAKPQLVVGSAKSMVGRSDPLWAFASLGAPPLVCRKCERIEVSGNFAAKRRETLAQGVSPG